MPSAKHPQWNEFWGVSPVRHLALSEPWINLSQASLFPPKSVRYSLRTEHTAKPYYQLEESSELEACQRYWQLQLYGVENEKERKRRDGELVREI